MHKSKGLSKNLKIKILKEEIRLIFDVERNKFMNLWHVYHARHNIPYSYDEAERFFNSLLEIFREG